MRKLASIRKIAAVEPIVDADAIEVATVDGWKVVVKKGEYNAGDVAIYLEIDSWVPNELAPFLSKGREPREYNGVVGERLTTVKLRGQISQGLLLPLSVLKDMITDYLPGGYVQIGDEKIRLWEVSTNVTEILGIQKWEPEIPAQLAGQVAGVFPTRLAPKTDQERIQNCFEEIEAREGATYEVTMKLDGTSCSILRHEGELRVCGRNYELKINEENATNTLVRMALEVGDKIPEGFVFQGEVMGPGVQGNREGFKEHQFFVFDIFNIEDQAYLNPHARRLECEQRGIQHVPVFEMAAAAPTSVEEGLTLAEGPSINHSIREGLVWKCNEDPTFSFKTISNKFLLKGGN
jgi:RNA ligase (TIGR02306 family)